MYSLIFFIASCTMKQFSRPRLFDFLMWVVLLLLNPSKCMPFCDNVKNILWNPLITSNRNGSHTWRGKLWLVTKLNSVFNCCCWPDRISHECWMLCQSRLTLYLPWVPNGTDGFYSSMGNTLGVKGLTSSLKEYLLSWPLGAQNQSNWP